MKHTSIFLLAVPMVLASCGVTRIVTVVPEPTPVAVAQPAQTTVVVAQPQPQVVYQTPVSTTVTYPRTRTTRTTTIEVTPTTQDISLYLDLQAVAAAFAQSNSVEEFEMILNSSSYIISNLDLNHDGYIDYLRVLETIEGYNHVLLIQSVLAANIYQDVATLVVEMGYATPYVQVIGAPYIYGANYIIEPVYYKRPPMYDRWGRPHYSHWRSPYYWDHFPHHYGHHAPYHLGHYQAYVHTYMENHHYCHNVHYVDHYHYGAYENVSRPVSRNDYGQHYAYTRKQRTPSAAVAGAVGRYTYDYGIDKHAHHNLASVQYCPTGTRHCYAATRKRFALYYFAYHHNGATRQDNRYAATRQDHKYAATCRNNACHNHLAYFLYSTAYAHHNNQAGREDYCSTCQHNHYACSHIGYNHYQAHHRARYPQECG